MDGKNQKNIWWEVRTLWDGLTDGQTELVTLDPPAGSAGPKTSTPEWIGGKIVKVNLQWSVGVAGRRIS